MHFFLPLSFHLCNQIDFFSYYSFYTIWLSSPNWIGSSRSIRFSSGVLLLPTFCSDGSRKLGISTTYFGSPSGLLLSSSEPLLVRHPFFSATSRLRSSYFGWDRCQALPSRSVTRILCSLAVFGPLQNYLSALFSQLSHCWQHKLHLQAATTV